MKHFLLLLFLAATAFPERAGVTRASVAGMEKAFDRRLLRDVVENPFLLLGATRGVYLDGYGAVFSAEVNLAVGPTASLFRPQLTKEDLAKLKQKKVDRLPVLRQAMREMLVASAGSLDGMPAEERLVVAVSLFNFNWEDASGLPSQIVMQAQKKQLLEFQTGARNRAEMPQAIKVQEF